MFCSGQKTFILPEYQGKTFTKPGLFIVPERDTLSILDQKLFYEVGLNLSRINILDGFNNSLKNMILQESNFNSIGLLETDISPILATKFLNFGSSKKLNMELPSNPLKIQYDGDIFLLLIDDLKVVFSKSKRESSDPAKSYTVSRTPGDNNLLHNMKSYEYFVSIQVKYALIDNQNTGLISYGIVSSKDDFDLNKGFNGLLDGMLKDLAKAILADTPFMSR